MKKKVLFMIHNMNVGGTEKSLLSLLSVLDKNKYDVTILMFEKKGDYLENIPNWVKTDYLKGYKEIKPIVMNPPLQTIKDFILKGEFVKTIRTFFSYIRAKMVGNWVFFYRQVLKNYPITSYDIAIAYAGPSDFITYFIAEKIHASKKIQWIHFDVLKIKLNTNFGKMYYPEFNVIYCVSENSKYEMQQAFPNVKDRIKVFKNIVNTKEIIELAKEGNSLQDNFKGIRIVTLGRLSHEKGQQMIPEVAQKLRNMGYQFRWYCIGEGILQKEIENEIIKRNIKDELVLLGMKKNPYVWLEDCDLYVQTSLHEGYGLTIHEAKIFNNPIVTTNFTGVKEQIQDGVNGKIVPISSEGLYQGIKEILDDKELGIKFSQNLEKENSLTAEKRSIFL